MFAKVVCLEGPDSVGKSTQSKLLFEHYQRQGLRTSLVKVPYNDRLTHRLIYGMLDDGNAKRYPNLFQFIQLVNKLIFQVFVFPILFLTKDVVVLDRWTMSAKVYGQSSGAHRFVTHTLNKLLFSPTATVLLTHKHKRVGTDDSYERDTDLQDRVKSEYLKIASLRGDVINVDAKNLGSPLDVSLWIVHKLWQHNFPTAPKPDACQCHDFGPQNGVLQGSDEPPIKPWRNI